ncbi:type II RES/Xre toxin-antitoxin system antitoxin [Pontibacter pamirensis]|uniref:type II RES/Xre toxin-antitoxin system antitoxin n=1 Tax=Pontibacter pamirensis TaxID=2562824 RepID=UPI00138A56BF|nr:antitoxin Xre/MbcA/ParS toxin-binding domain-containing protein [Pontibacter pamirensis]
MSLESIVEVLGGEENIGRNVHGRGDYIKVFREGRISVRGLKVLQRKVRLTNVRMASILHISESKYQRIKQQDMLGKAESDAVYNVSKVYAKGMEVLGDEEDLNRWLNTENQALGNEKPIDWLDSSIGREQLMNVLTAIEYGHYS